MTNKIERSIQERGKIESAINEAIQSKYMGVAIDAKNGIQPAPESDVQTLFALDIETPGAVLVFLENRGDLPKSKVVQTPAEA